MLLKSKKREKPDNTSFNLNCITSFNELYGLAYTKKLIEINLNNIPQRIVFSTGENGKYRWLSDNKPVNRLKLLIAQGRYSHVSRPGLNRLLLVQYFGVFVNFPVVVTDC